MELARFSTSLRIQDRAECDKGTELHWARGGGHHTEKTYTGARDTTHTLLIGGIIGVGTPHNIERNKLGLSWAKLSFSWDCVLPELICTKFRNKKYYWLDRLSPIITCNCAQVAKTINYLPPVKTTHQPLATNLLLTAPNSQFLPSSGPS